MTTKTTRLAAVALCFAAAVSHAETNVLVRFHFDEAAVDGVLTGMTAVNAANPGTLDGVWYNVANKTYNFEDSSNHGARGAVAFAEPLAVYDPITGDLHVNRRAWVTNGRVDATSHDGKTSSAVRFKNGVTPQWTTFTAEAFIRMTSSRRTYMNTNSTAKQYCQTIFGVGSAWNADLWGVHYKAGQIIARCSGADGTPIMGTKINDDIWHHVALVVDSTSGTSTTLTLYVDYSIAGTMTLPAASLDYTKAAYPFTIGAHPSLQTTGKFMGLIDEFRVTDAALQPAQFLQLAKTSDVTTDASAWFAMEEWPASGYEDYAKIVKNMAVSGPWDRTSGTSGYTIKPLAFGGGSKYDGAYTNTFVQSELYADRVRNRNAVKVFDAGSFLTHTNETPTVDTWKQVSYQVVTSPSGTGLTDDSFTLEFFAKSNGPNRLGGNSTLLMVPKSTSNLKDPSPALQLYATSGGSLYGAFTKESDGIISYPSIAGNVHDSAWHHYAVVYDKSAQTLKFYLDRRLRKTVENVTLAASLNQFVLGAKGTMWNNNYGFCGWLDELRITGRALDRQELMSLNARRSFLIIIR